MSTIDLNAPPPDHVFSISVERQESTAERNVRLFKEVLLFLVAICFVVAIAIVCFRTVWSGTASADEKKWAMSVLSAAAGGIVGYLVKR